MQKSALEKAFKSKRIREEGGFLYYGLLFYIIFIYLHVGSRFPALEAIRPQMIFACVLLIGTLQAYSKGKARFEEKSLIKAAFFFMIVSFLTIPTALVKTRALLTSIDLLKAFAIFPIIVAAIDTRKKLTGLIFVYFSMSCVLFIEPFLLSLAGKGFIYNNFMMRLAGATSYFGHPNGLGMITASSLPFLLCLAKNRNSNALRLLCLILFIVGLRVIMLTNSRTGFVGVFACVVFIWATSRHKATGLVMLAGFLVLVWAFAPEDTRSRFMTLFSSTRLLSGSSEELHSELGSMASRWELMLRTLIAFSENPILGIGQGCFISWNGTRYGLWFPTHNTYLQMLAETGLVGMTCFSAVIWFTFRNLTRAMKAKTLEKGSLLASAIEGLRAHYVVWLTAAFFGIELLVELWWIVAGLSVVALQVLEVKGSPVKSRKILFSHSI